MVLKRTGLFLTLSALLHLSLILLLVIPLSPTELPLAGGGGGGGHIDVTLEASSPTLSSPPSKSHERKTGHPLPKGGRGTGEGNQQGGGSGLEGTNPLLAEIRSRIERHKRYPLRALRSGVQGKVLVKFQIQEDGTTAAIEIRQSSGSKLLDEEAIATIQRAAPYPSYAEPLLVWLSYQ